MDIIYDGSNDSDVFTEDELLDIVDFDLVSSMSRDVRFEAIVLDRGEVDVLVIGTEDDGSVDRSESGTVVLKKNGVETRRVTASTKTLELLSILTEKILAKDSLEGVGAGLKMTFPKTWCGSEGYIRSVANL